MDHDKIDGSDDVSARARDESAPRSRRHARSPRRRRAASTADSLQNGKMRIADAAVDIYQRALEAGDYGKTLIDIQQDRAGLAIRRKTRQFAWIGIAACIGITWLVTATLFLVHGVADGLTAWFGGRAWLGNLTAGVLLLGVATGLVAGAIRRRDKAQLSKQVKKYEGLRNRHRERHGRHVADGASTPYGGGAPGHGGAVGARRTAAQFE